MQLHACRKQSMDNALWKSFFYESRTILGVGSHNAFFSETWCAWTTFHALREGVHYWYCGLPDFPEIHDTHIEDGGTWGQPFSYGDLAHVIIPARFYWESQGGPDFRNGLKSQNIEKLSLRLDELGVPHRITELVLEIKLY